MISAKLATQYRRRIEAGEQFSPYIMGQLAELGITAPAKASIAAPTAAVLEPKRSSEAQAEYDKGAREYFEAVEAEKIKATADAIASNWRKN